MAKLLELLDLRGYALNTTYHVLQVSVLVSFVVRLLTRPSRECKQRFVAHNLYSWIMFSNRRLSR